MTIIELRAVSQTHLSAFFNGKYACFPKNEGNYYYKLVISSGLDVPEYIEPPAPPATDTLINRVQFKSMLAILGKSTDDVINAIDAVITDPTQNTIAKVKVTDSDRYARDNALFTILAPSLNLTDEQIDAAWEQAVLI